MPAQKCSTCDCLISSEYAKCPICKGTDFDIIEDEASRFGEDRSFPNNRNSFVISAVAVSMAVVLAVVFGFVQGKNSSPLALNDFGSVFQSSEDNSSTSQDSKLSSGNEANPSGTDSSLSELPDGYSPLNSNIDPDSVFGWNRSGGDNNSCSGENNCAFIDLVSLRSCNLVTVDIQFTTDDGEAEDDSGIYQNTEAGVPFLLEIGATSSTSFTHWTFQQVTCS